MSLRELKVGEKVRVKPDSQMTHILPYDLPKSMYSEEFEILKTGANSVLLAMPCNVGGLNSIVDNANCDCGKCKSQRWSWWVHVEELA
jgi:5-methylcytosine-specific restriction endonuclease McrA